MNTIQSINAETTTQAPGLQLSEGLTFEQWAAYLPRLNKGADWVLWALGDWIVYGRSRPEWKAHYTATLKETGYTAGTIRNAAWVAQSVNSSRRRDKLRWSHHLEVAGLPSQEQDAWLEKAEANGWGVHALRAEIKAMEGNPLAPVHQGRGLVTIEGVRLWFDRWERVAFASRPLPDWSPAQRAALKDELQPIVELYEQL